MHNYSEISARLDVVATTIHFLSNLFTGQFVLHYKPHFYGLQRSGITTAIRVIPSLFYFPFYDMVQKNVKWQKVNEFSIVFLTLYLPLYVTNVSDEVSNIEFISCKMIILTYN